MKKLIFTLALIFVGSMTFAANSQKFSFGDLSSRTVISENSYLTPDISGDLAVATPMAKFKVDMNLTSREGCIVRIVGVVDADLVPPRFNSFAGSVHLLGGAPGCPTGTFTFGMRGVEPGSSTHDLFIELDNADINIATKFIWTGNADSNILQLLNDLDHKPLLDEIRRLIKN